MAEFKSVLYKNYRSTHNAHLYGEISIERIKKNFSVWRYYYEKVLPQNKSARILEIGCGDGGFVYFLQQLGYTQVTGIDLSQEQIDTGLKLGIKNLHVEEADNYLQGNTTYDLIIARDVVEHLTRQEAFDLLLKISGALTQGGGFVMQVPNGEGIYVSSIFYGDYTHEMAYTASSVRQLFLNTGFKNITCFPTGPVPHTWKGFVRIWLWRVKVMIHRFWKMVETGNHSGIFTSNLIAIGRK